jgi:hypothetical protein
MTRKSYTVRFLTLTSRKPKIMLEGVYFNTLVFVNALN